MTTGSIGDVIRPGYFQEPDPKPTTASGFAVWVHGELGCLSGFCEKVLGSRGLARALEAARVRTNTLRTPAGQRVAAVGFSELRGGLVLTLYDAAGKARAQCATEGELQDFASRNGLVAATKVYTEALRAFRQQINRRIDHGPMHW
jgi:hypothetical protein